MSARFFSQSPQPVAPPAPAVALDKTRRARSIHRAVAILFTLTVSANFAAMPWGPPPAWITYAPLPPLLFLTITGLAMLVSSWIGKGHASCTDTKGELQ